MKHMPQLPASAATQFYCPGLPLGDCRVHAVEHQLAQFLEFLIATVF